MPRSQLAFALCVIASVYWVALFLATHSAPSGQDEPGLKNADKLAHCASYAGLALLLCGSGAAGGMTGQRLYASVLGLVALYGLFDESTQPWVAREGDPEDWLADLVGAGIGVTAFALCADFLIAWRLRRPAGAAAPPANPNSRASKG